MKTTKLIFWLTVIVISIIVLVYLARKTIDSNTLPSFSGLISSSTDRFIEPTEKIPLQDGIIVNIKAPLGILHATVSSSEASQEKGLSGKTSISADEGMLFQFSEIGDYGFWMKDMLFPIDIVWIGEDKEVKSIDANVSPETYPNAFHPSEAILYVLELNAGSSEKMGIKVGTQLEF